MDIGAAGLLRMNAGEIGGGGARVIAGAIAMRAGGIEAEAGDNGEVFGNICQWSERCGKREIGADGGRREVWHPHAVGEEKISRANGRLRRGRGERRRSK